MTDDKIDVLKIFEQQLQAGWKVRDDGKIIPREVALDPNLPFVLSNLDRPDFNCLWLMNVMFEKVYRGNAIAIRCHSCYKVVLAPTSLEDVHRIEKFQRANAWPAKVGMETRPTVKRPWGAYWYTKSVEEGRERYRRVKEWADANLRDPFKILLKRGCTEYEQSLGPSDKWRIAKGQKEIEDAIGEAVIPLGSAPDQPENIVNHIHERWKEWAELMRPYVTYHEEE